MYKDIGFNRNIKLDWLNATASYCAELDDPSEIRTRLEVVLAQDRSGAEAIRKSIDILVNIWHKNGEQYPELLDFALKHFQDTFHPSDRLWLHFGLTSLYFSFFRETSSVIGKISKRSSLITTKEVIKQLISERGHLGSLERSVQRIISSLRDWDVLTESDQSFAYQARYRELETESMELETWLLQCAFIGKNVEQILFEDLIRLPELFPFKIKVGLDYLRKNTPFSVYRAGGRINMVELSSYSK
ncbi:hypothetical protein ACFLV7_12315 [Chloroflexota bacterium]